MSSLRFKALLRPWRRRRVLFYRDFQGYTGGHQKVYDYFCHFFHHRKFLPFISFSERSLWNNDNPWFPEYAQRRVEFTPRAYDLLFLAGMDWQAYLDSGALPDTPVINLIQHVRHADPMADVYPFLTRRAIRVCVSAEVRDAIAATGKVNGPLFSIPNGHHIPAVPSVKRRLDFLVVGSKQPDLARKVAARLPAGDHHLLDSFIPRTELLENMAAARVVVMLPNPTEGFYLPALEAMQLAEVAVVPDCIGNRSFCRDGVNCLRPQYTVEGIASAARSAQELLADRERLKTLKLAALDTVRSHSLEQERRALFDILDNLDQLW